MDLLNSDDCEYLVTDLETSSSTGDDASTSCVLPDNDASTGPAKVGSESSGKNRNIRFAEKDDDHVGYALRFLGQHRVNIHGEPPVDYFMGLFPTLLLEHIVFHWNLCGVQYGKESLRLTVPELKVFLGIFPVIIYIKYFRIRHYWSNETSLRLGIPADVISVNRCEEQRRFLHFHDNNELSSDNNNRVAKI